MDTDRVGEALDRLLERYPYLLEEPSPPENDGEKTKTRQPAPLPRGKKVGDRAALEKQVPGLAGTQAATLNESQ